VGHVGGARHVSLKVWRFGESHREFREYEEASAPLRTKRKSGSADLSGEGLDEKLRPVQIAEVGRDDQFGSRGGRAPTALAMKGNCVAVGFSDGRVEVLWGALDGSSKMKSAVLVVQHQDSESAPSDFGGKSTSEDRSSKVSVSGSVDGDADEVEDAADEIRSSASSARMKPPPPGETPVIFVGFSPDSEHLFTATSSRLVVFDLSKLSRESNQPQPPGNALETFYNCVPSASQVALAPPVGDAKHKVLKQRGPSRPSGVPQSYAALVIARQDGCFFYGVRDRGQCLAFPVQASSVRVLFFRGYLVVLTAGVGADSKHTDVACYDLERNVIAHRSTVETLIACTLEVGTLAANGAARPGALWLVGRNGAVFQLQEKSLEERVSLLRKRELFTEAVNLIESEGGWIDDDHPSLLLTETVKEFAQSSISKGKYDNAANILSVIISSDLEPSWVITKLVDQPGSRSGLRTYLEALHSARHANEEHTQLLLACYSHERARSDTVKKSSEAVLREAFEPGRSSPPPSEDIISRLGSDSENIGHFLAAVADADDEEVDKIIVAFRTAGLYSSAVLMARKRERHCLLAQVLVYDLDEIDECVKLLTRVSPNTAVEITQTCGRLMLKKSPERFIRAILEVLCTLPEDTAAPNAARPTIENFCGTFIDCPRWLSVFLEGALDQILLGRIPERTETTSLWLLLFESLVKVDVGGVTGEMMCDACPHSRAFSTESDKPRGVRAESIGNRAIKLLQSPRAQIDLLDALRISKLYGHNLCLEYIYENLRMYKELAIHLRLQNDGPGLLRACRRHGDREHMLWINALNLFVPLATEETLRGGAMSSNSAEMNALNEVISAIDRNDILTTLELIKLIASCSPNVPVGLISTYVEKKINSVISSAEEEEASLSVYAMDLEKMRLELNGLEKAPLVVRRKRCCLCEQVCELPAIHYYCGHSLHVSCLAVNAPVSRASPTPQPTPPPSSVPSPNPFDRAMERAAGEDGGEGGSVGGGEAGGVSTIGDCPVCAAEYESIRGMQEAVMASGAMQDEFFRVVRESKDGFGTICEYLSRCPF